MSSGTPKGSFQPDSDVNITFEDQEKINRFARLYAKIEDMKEDLRLKENDLKTMEDACDEITLFDDTEQIPYQVGEVFIYQSLEKTQECLEEAKKNKQLEIEDINKKCAEIRELMSGLKTHLYGKFGNHINLDGEED